MNFNTLLQTLRPQVLISRALSCHSSGITKIHRATYGRVYPTLVVLPNGATIRVRYQEPRQIIKLPLDLSTLSEAEKRLRLERRKPKQKLRVEEEIEDGFDASKYLQLRRK